MNPKVCIIILHFGNWSDTQECLESLKKITYDNYEIVVVNNDLRDIPIQSDGNIKVIKSESNNGFAGGNNLGINYALNQKAEYVLLLNNDTVVDSNFLNELMIAARQNLKYAILGPKIYFADEADKLWFAGGKINWLYNKGTMRGYAEKDTGQYDEPLAQETDYITGCCMLISSSVIEKIGPMSEDYFLYYEDTDWCLKARQQGYSCIFIPRSKIWHKGSKATVAGSDSYIYYHIRNGLMMAQRFAPSYIKVLVYLDSLWRILKQYIKMLIYPQKKQIANIIILAIKDFYNNKTGKYENRN
jgi:hypothetical protein